MDRETGDVTRPGPEPSQAVQRKPLSLSHPTTLLVAGVVIVLLLLSIVSYPVARTITGVCVLVVAFSLFSLVWTTREQLKNGSFAIAGAGLLFAGILELASTLASAGAAASQGLPAGSSWVLGPAAWYMYGITLLAATLAAGGSARLPRLVVTYGAATAAILLLVFGFPPIPSPEPGSLAAILVAAGPVAIIAVAAIVLAYSGKKFDSNVFSALLAGYLLSVGAALLVLFSWGIPWLTAIGYILWFGAVCLWYVCCIIEVVDRPAAALERALKTCRLQFRIMNDYTHDWEYWTRPDRTFVYTTPSCKTLTGYSPVDFYEDHTLVERIIHPRDKEKAVPHFVAESPSSNYASIEFRIVTRDKNVRWIHHSCSPVFDDKGTLLGRRATNRDITMQKNAEREILHLASFSMQAPVLIAEISPDGKPLFVNPAMEKTLFDLGSAGPGVFAPADLLERLKAGELATDATYSREVVSQGRFFSESAVVTPENDALRLYITDVTRERTAEKKIEEQSAFLATLLDTIPVPIFYRDLQGAFLGCNTAFERFTGIGKEDLLSGTFPGRTDEGLAAILEVRGGDGAVIPETCETTLISADGSLHDVVFFRAPFFAADRTPGGTIGTFLDITERKRMEKALSDMNEELTDRVRERTRDLERSNAALQEEVARRSLAEESLKENLGYTRTVFESNIDPMVVLTPEGIIKDVNAATEQMTGLSRDVLIGSSFSHYLKGSGDLAERYREIVGTGRVEAISGKMIRSDGHATPVQVNAAAFTGARGGVEGIIISAHDVTRQKEDEAVIRASLHEKTVLLREIHHRVKNNLQIIISLLNLQARRIDDEQMLESFQESIQRVRAMSLVHEKLYGGGDLAHINIRGYIYSLINSLIAFYNVNKGTISLKVDADNIMVDVSTAVPLGLIINELILNSIKHAFPGGRRGSIAVGAKDVDGWLVVTVGDDGIGISPGLDWQKADSLGLRLVNALSQQLEGTLTLDQEQGTKFSLRIPLS